MSLANSWRLKNIFRCFWHMFMSLFNLVCVCPYFQPFLLQAVREISPKDNLYFLISLNDPIEICAFVCVPQTQQQNRMQNYYASARLVGPKFFNRSLSEVLERPLYMTHYHQHNKLKKWSAGKNFEKKIKFLSTRFSTSVFATIL